MTSITEATTPLDLRDNDPGLMTLDEYLKHRNDRNEWHPDESYDSTIYDMNYQFYRPTSTNNSISFHDGSSWLSTTHIHDGTVHVAMKHELNTSPLDGQMAAIWYQNTWYYHPRRVSPKGLESSDLKGAIVPIKYLDKKLEEIIHEYAHQKNVSKHPNILKRIKIDGEIITLRENPKHHTMALLRPNGQQIASASNEWGTTLIQVAKEYRGNRIGPWLGDQFIQKYNLPSGGYTDAGRKNATKIWNNRVSTFIKNGWYSELVKTNELTKSRVKEIISNFTSGGKTLPDNNPSVTIDKTEPRQYLCFLVDDSGFILYDKKFLTDQNPDYIYGLGLLRTDHYEKLFLVRFDYVDEDAKKILTYIILQTLRNNKETLDTTPQGSDMIDVDGLKHITQNDGIVTLDKDMLNVDHMFKSEEMIRTHYDKYSDIENALHEMAESKFK